MSSPVVPPRFSAAPAVVCIDLLFPVGAQWCRAGPHAGDGLADDFISAFAEVGASGAGILNISPVTVITAGGLVFHNKELAIVGKGPAVGIITHAIIGVVNRVSAGGAVMVRSIFTNIAQGILKIETAVLCLRPVAVQTLHRVTAVRIPDKGIVGADLIQSALGVPLI